MKWNVIGLLQRAFDLKLHELFYIISFLVHSDFVVPSPCLVSIYTFNVYGAADSLYFWTKHKILHVRKRSKRTFHSEEQPGSHLEM